MSWHVITAPSREPLALPEVKAHLRLDTGDEDAVVSSLIVSARQHIEVACNRALMPQTWRMRLDRFHGKTIYLSGGPFRSIVSVSYIDTAGAVQVVPSDDYVSRLQEPARISAIERWPDTKGQIEAVTIDAEVGYADAASVPDPIKHAMKMLIGSWFDNRSAVNVGNITSVIPMAVESLLFPYRDGSAM